MTPARLAPELPELQPKASAIAHSKTTDRRRAFKATSLVRGTYLVERPLSTGSALRCKSPGGASAMGPATDGSPNFDAAREAPQPGCKWIVCRLSIWPGISLEVSVGRSSTYGHSSSREHGCLANSRKPILQVGFHARIPAAGERYASLKRPPREKYAGGERDEPTSRKKGAPLSPRKGGAFLWRRGASPPLRNAFERRSLDLRPKPTSGSRFAVPLPPRAGPAL